MALNCGTNLSLDGLNDVRDEIKNALTQGKDALADLQSKVSEATAQFEGLKAEIEENVSSFQEDLQGLSTKFGEEFAQAQNELREKWGDVVDDIEGTLATIPSIDDIISGQASLPDLCKEVENIAVKINEDGTKEKIVKAAAAIKPNINSIEVPKFEPVVIDSSKIVSTANPSSGYFQSDWSEVHANYFSVKLQKFADNYDKPLFDLNQQVEDLRKTPDYISLIKKARDTGLKYKQLLANGSVTTGEQKVRDLFIELDDERKLIRYKRINLSTIIDTYEKFAQGQVTQSRWDVVYDNLNNDEKFDSNDVAFVDELTVLIDQYADDIKAYNNYLNKSINRL